MASTAINSFVKKLKKKDTGILNLAALVCSEGIRWSSDQRVNDERASHKWVLVHDRKYNYAKG